MKLIDLQKFRKNNPNSIVFWTKNCIKTDDGYFKLKEVKVGNKYYPYVQVPETKLPKPKKYTLRILKEELDNIQKVNDNKENLKGISYLVGNNEYYVTGIGDYSIKAFKNDNDEPSYIWYNTNEGKLLLRHLISKIGQTKLAING